MAAIGHSYTVFDRRPGNKFGLQLDRIKVCTEKTAHNFRIGTATAQICGCIKGAYARLDGKILRVDDDTRLERRRFKLVQLHIFLVVLNQLRDELTC